MVGHSVGEVSAAYVSGALSLRDALLVSYHRVAAAGHHGGHRRDARRRAARGTRRWRWLAPAQPGVDVAAVNSPSAVTLAGDEPALDELADRLADGGVSPARCGWRCPTTAT